MPPRRIVDQLNEGDNPEDDDREELEAAPEDDNGPEEEDDEERPEGDDDDEGDDSETPAGDEDEDPLPQRTRARRENDVARLRRERREERQRREEAEDELARVRAGHGQQQQQEPEAVRRARLAAMEPDERVSYLLDEERGIRQRERQADRFEAMDRSDRDMYAERARTNPRYKKYQGEVERRLRLLRAQGQNAPRDSILKFIVGERVLDGAGSPRTTQERKDAKRRVEREEVTLPRGRGDNRGRGGSKRADLEKRLANVPI